MFLLRVIGTFHNLMNQKFNLGHTFPVIIHELYRIQKYKFIIYKNMY